MTLYISDNQQKKKIPAVLLYLLGAIFCIIFNRVYAQFAHGVSSDYMGYMYLVPLTAGFLNWVLRMGAGWDSRFLTYGAMTLTIGCCLQGVFEIAGTESPYMIVYLVAGAVLLGLSFLLHFIPRFGTMKKKNENEVFR